jgi:hypothetical protein
MVQGPTSEVVHFRVPGLGFQVPSPHTRLDIEVTPRPRHVSKNFPRLLMTWYAGNQGLGKKRSSFEAGASPAKRDNSSTRSLVLVLVVEEIRRVWV